MCMSFRKGNPRSKRHSGSRRKVSHMAIWRNFEECVCSQREWNIQRTEKAVLGFLVSPDFSALAFTLSKLRNNVNGHVRVSILFFTTFFQLLPLFGVGVNECVYVDSKFDAEKNFTELEGTKTVWHWEVKVENLFNLPALRSVEFWLKMFEIQRTF